MPEMTKAEVPPPSMITLALDWLPNTNHTGFFVAQVRCELCFKYCHLSTSGLSLSSAAAFVVPRSTRAGVPHIVETSVTPAQAFAAA